jgi:hypothetical protein
MLCVSTTRFTMKFHGLMRILFPKQHKNGICNFCYFAMTRSLCERRARIASPCPSNLGKLMKGPYPSFMATLPLRQETSRTSLHASLHPPCLLLQNAAGLWNTPVLHTREAARAIPMNTTPPLTLEKMTTASKSKRKDALFSLYVPLPHRHPRISTKPRVLQPSAKEDSKPQSCLSALPGSMPSNPFPWPRNREIPPSHRPHDPLFMILIPWTKPNLTSTAPCTSIKPRRSTKRWRKRPRVMVLLKPRKRVSYLCSSLHRYVCACMCAYVGVCARM